MGGTPDSGLLIAGLGNPGPEYEETRHNVGRMAVRRLAGKFRLRLSFNRRLSAWVGRRGKITLAVPESFMNECGPVVARLARTAGTNAPLVVSDDMDLPLGTIRFRSKGGSGGHRGVASVISALGTEAFPRLRIGVGRPVQKSGVVDFVLSPFGDDERELRDKALEKAALALKCAAREGLEKAMTRYSE